MREMQRIVIVGGGFGGLNCAKALAKRRDTDICLIDRRNYHLFQPLLYQVAMAGLSPGDIAAPIRGLFSRSSNVRVVHAEVDAINAPARRVFSTAGSFDYDYLVLATGAEHAYFGNDSWEDHAPGLKTLEQATEIRRRVLTAFERAECEPDQTRRRAMLTFVVVGGGPTGVELAGAIGEMTRFTLARDFRNIDPKLTRIVLIEAGPRILASFEPLLSSRATSELERLGVQVWTNSSVTHISADGVYIGQEHLSATSVIWAAGVQASAVGASLNTEQDRQGRVIVGADLSVPGYPEVLVIGDQSHFRAPYMDRPLPGVASVAIQQGQHAARTIGADLDGVPRAEFRYRDKGQMATIGRRRAVMQRGGFRSAGVFAWFMWLLVHIYFLSGFRSRIFVLMQWSWSYLTFARGTRLIVEKEWRSHAHKPPAAVSLAHAAPLAAPAAPLAAPASPPAASPPARAAAAFAASSSAASSSVASSLAVAPQPPLNGGSPAEAAPPPSVQPQPPSSARRGPPSSLRPPASSATPPPLPSGAFHAARTEAGYDSSGAPPDEAKTGTWQVPTPDPWDETTTLYDASRRDS
jgi:NADH dehydrogenase